MQVSQLALPLPAIFLITVGLYMLLLGTVLWLRYCFKDCCSVSCPDCCSGMFLGENCFKMAEACDCRPPSVRSCFAYICPSPSEQRQCRCRISGSGMYEIEHWCQSILQTRLCDCPVILRTCDPLLKCLSFNGPSFTRPSFTGPSFNCPSFNCPSFNCPSFNCPSFNCPSFTGPTFNCPCFHCPSFNCPSFNCPSFTGPTFNCPSFNCPTFNCPSFNCPSFTGPTFNCPSFNCPSFNFPCGRCESGARLCECHICVSVEQCSNLDCACTYQPPECNTCNCLCFEIRIK